MYDVIIVGGSYAGMAAALQLVRARRTVLIVDAGQRRNRFARTSHGLLGQDGRAPEAIFADAKTQLLKYPDLTWRDGVVESAARDEDGFVVRTGAGDTVTGRRLVLATGVKDHLPDVPGLAERWGDTVILCPYCHGYEFDRGRLGVLAVSDVSMHQALLVPDWAGSTVLLTNGVFVPDAEQRRRLAARGVAIEPEPVTDVFDAASVRLRDGRTIALDGLFIASRIDAGPLARELGCALVDGPVGALVQTDEMKATSVPGVFACGDVARAMASLSLAIGDGALAGAAVHRSLVFDGLH